MKAGVITCSALVRSRRVKVSAGNSTRVRAPSTSSRL